MQSEHFKEERKQASDAQQMRELEEVNQAQKVLKQQIDANQGKVSLRQQQELVKLDERRELVIAFNEAA